MKYLGLYIEFYKVKLKSIAEYRGAFFMTSLAKFLNYIASFIMIWIMINAFGTIGDWGKYEVMLIYALNTAAYAIAGSFTYHLTVYISQWIKEGVFDEVLTKPLNPFLYLASRLYSTGYFGTMAIAVVVMIICFINLGIAITPLKLLFLIITILSGGVINASLMILGSAPAFWVVETRSISWFVASVGSLTDYPVSIYPAALQGLVTFVLPYAFISFFPAQFVLGKSDFTIFNPVFQYLAPLVAAVIFFIAYRVWMLGVSHYNSTGS